MPKDPKGHSRITQEAIGQYVRAARHKRDITQDAAADAMGVKLNSYQRYESGERTSSWLRLVKLCKAIGTTPNIILGFGEDKSKVRLDDPVVRQRLVRAVAQAASVTHQRGLKNPKIFGDDGRSPDPSELYWQAISEVIAQALEEENDDSESIMTRLRTVDRGLSRL